MFYENPDFDNEDDNDDGDGNYTPSFGGFGTFIAKRIVKEVVGDVVRDTWESVKNSFGGDDDD